MSNNSRIARPLSITSILQATSTAQTNNRRRVSSISDHDKKKNKRPTSRLSKSHSMHRLADSYPSDDEEEEEDYDTYQQQMHRRALLSRATTTPMPRPSSLIKRFSTEHHNSGVLVGSPKSSKAAAVKSASLTTSTTTSNVTTSSMRRSSSLMNPVEYGGNDYTDLRIGQRVSIPSLSVFGTVRFYGETKFTNGGNWVGIELDIKGTGKNDGSIQGVRYFSCAPDSGIFILSNKVVAEKTITPCVSKTTHKSIIPAAKKSMIKRNQPTPSKSARISSHSHQQPLPTRSSPSINKKSNPIVPLSKPATTKLKKSCSLSTTSSSETGCHHRHSNHEAPEKKKMMRASSSSKTTRNEVDELKRVSALLEQSRQEQKALSQQMDGKEAAWERLLSAKESYALRVQEKEDELNRLRRQFEQTRLANEQLTKLTSEKDGALSRASMSEAMEKQHIKVIERLDLRVRTLQDQNANLISSHEYKMRDNAAQIDQIRKQLAARDEATAAIERDCAELRQLNRENSRVYESSLIQCKQEYENMISIKNTQIQRLQHIVNDFSHCLPSSPLTPIVDDTRRRLEAQLELSTQELDRERELRKTMSDDIDQLKAEIKRLHRVSVSSSSQFYSIREELDHEIKDKVRIMEEANAALETQSRIEEENERIRLTHDKTQRDLADLLKKMALMEKQQQQQRLNVHEESLVDRNRQLELENECILESQRQTEHECMRLMDELLAIEKVNENQQEDQGDGNRIYKREIEQLKLQVVRETKKYQDLENSKQVKLEQLNKELNDLESLVENKVFNETELEETLQNEKKKVRLLEAKLKEEEEKNHHHKRVLLNNLPPMSPTSPQYSSIFHINKKRSSSATASSFSLMTSSSLDTVSDHGSNLLESVYCEICEEYGHDVMTCNAFVQMDEYDDTLSSSSFYCVNCDVFGTHPTEECPNQDETF
ncbi:hypothetical protein BDF21DRAFT_454745 [Thamnidium elegans]|nr:hypothetical protein BDF21DRAFT_454745 [Thamnidium elegans]